MGSTEEDPGGSTVGRKTQRSDENLSKCILTNSKVSGTDEPDKSFLDRFCDKSCFSFSLQHVLGLRMKSTGCLMIKACVV